jgi:predicted enzyme related to lactoylglutathione lyase
VVEPPQLDAEGRQWVATFRDPAGNLIGLYQDESRE